MARVKCKACGDRYDYHEHGCCPECGAYNRPPQRDWIEADGTVHHMSEEEFFDEASARRRQRGKVCFEREECHEDKVRRSASPFDSVPVQKKKKKDSSSAGGIKKLVKLVALLVVLVNLLPVLLTMCSVNGVLGGVEDFFTNVSVEPARPEQLPDGQTEYTAEAGNTFLWWDHDAVVTEAVIEAWDASARLELTMWRDDGYDEPTVFYIAADGWQRMAVCEAADQRESHVYVYSYVLDGYQPGNECYAFFDGYNGNVYCEVKVPLEEIAAVMTPPEDAAQGDPRLGETFLWWDEEASVTQVNIHESGAGTDVNLTMYRADDFDEPIFYYINRYGAEMMAFCQSAEALGKGQYCYSFHAEDRQSDTDCWAVFSGYNGGEYRETRILLNG